MDSRLKVLRDPITKTVRYFSDGMELLLSDVLEGRLLKESNETKIEVSDGSARTLVLHDTKRVAVLEDYLGEFIDNNQKNTTKKEAYPDDVLEYLGVAVDESAIVPLKQKVTTLARSNKDGRTAYTVYDHKDKVVSFIDENESLLSVRDIQKHYPGTTLKKLVDDYDSVLLLDETSLKPSVLRIERDDKEQLTAYRFDRDAKSYRSKHGVLIDDDELDAFDAKVRRTGRTTLRMGLTQKSEVKHKGSSSAKPGYVKDAFLENLRRVVRENQELSILKPTNRKIESKPEVIIDRDDEFVF